LPTVKDIGKKKLKTNQN